MPRIFVGHAGDDHRAFGPGVIHRALRESRHVDRAERLLHHLRAIVGRIDHRSGKVLHVGDEAVGHAQWHETAARADPSAA
jgi:hypothetical protein